MNEHRILEEGLGMWVMVKIVGDESFSFNISENKDNKKGRKSIKSDGYIWIGKLIINL